MAGRVVDSGIGGEQWVEMPADLRTGESRRLQERQAELWALVLEAVGVPFRVERDGTHLRFLVPRQHYDEALKQLRLFEQESRDWPPPPMQETQVEKHNTLVTVSILLLLAAFHNITLLDLSLFGYATIDWIAVGSADAAKIASGEWWRTLTALTLHADWLHLSGNLLIGGFFIAYLCRDLGSGLGWTLLLASGCLGNLANSYVQPPGHTSIGASTTVFGAVGILAAAALVRNGHHRQKRRAVPLAAGIALLALLGTEGKNTDLGAHLLGFVFGMGVGLAGTLLVAKYGRPKRSLNVSLALFSCLAVVTAWWLAVAHA